MSIVKVDASKGFVSARDISTLREGELSEARACEYRVGSPHLYKHAGRSSRHAAMGDEIQAICRCQYDTAANVIVAVAGGTVYESVESITPTFATTGLTGLTDTTTPQFVGFNERWLMCDGINSNYIREPDPITGGTTGNWRTVGMVAPGPAPAVATVGSSSTAVRPNANSGTYQNPANAYDTNSATYSEGKVGKTVTYTWGSNFAADSCTLYIDHAAQGTSSTTRGPANPKFDTVDTGPSDASTLVVRYSLDNGVTWTNITTNPSFSRLTSTVVLSIGTSISGNLQVQATVGGTGAAAGHQIYDIRVTAGAAAPTTVTNTMYYAYSEAYVNSNSEVVESDISSIATVLAATLTGGYGATLTLATKVNTNATDFYIYRSVDDPAGGYPSLYRTGSVPSSATTFVDDYHYAPATIPTDGQLVPYLSVTYPDGSVTISPTNIPPPKAYMAVPFQGVMTYIPSGSGQGHFLFYSLSATLQKSGMEYVPPFQYLDFQSPRNDTITSVATTNGGKSLLAFFGNYTMLVNYLPQASDGVYDNRVKEYVSNNRGCAGRLACCEFTLPAGQTLVAAVDALGVWVTNGVNQMDEWSRDLDWTTDMVGVDLSTAQLIDNTAKRRLELLYLTADGTRQERHFFYGRLKEDGDGKPGPLITGPHPMGVQTKHYTQIGTAWVGFSGDATATGDVFLEETGATDDAHGYDSNGIIPWSFATGDIYPEGLSRANLLEQINLKFADGNPKTYNVDITCIRDKGTTYSLAKTYASGSQQQVYAHSWSDRFRIRLSDITATAASAFVGIETEFRDAGPSRDR